MSVNTETASAQGQTTVLEKEGVYASLFEKINLTPASSLGDINAFLDDAALSDAPAGERLTAAMQVFMDCIRKSGQPVEKLDKTLIDHHIAELDFQISRQLDAVMHHQEFQKVESLWRGLKQLVDSTDYLKPDWAVSYGDHLVQQALTLWPEEAKPLAQQWHKQISVAGLAESELNGWHQGMTQLQQLTNRLNALDEQKGKYMTVSELKSAVFAMSQSFSHTVPLEEQLRLLSILPAGQPLSAAQLNQTEQHLQQLIASYALLKHQKE